MAILCDSRLQVCRQHGLCIPGDLNQPYLESVEDNSSLDLVIWQAIEPFELVHEYAAYEHKVGQGRRYSEINEDSCGFVGFAIGNTPALAKRYEGIVFLVCITGMKVDA